MNAIDETAQALFLVKIVNGEPPREVIGGALDGLRYYVVIADGKSYWLTEDGLLTPDDSASSL